MYGIPPGADLSFLLGTTLIQVCIGRHETILHLEPTTSIMLASDVRVLESELTVDLRSALVVGAPLARLLSESITGVDGRADGTLRLFWTKADVVVEIIDTWDKYESYVITQGPRVVVV